MLVVDGARSVCFWLLCHHSRGPRGSVVSPSPDGLWLWRPLGPGGLGLRRKHACPKWESGGTVVEWQRNPAPSASWLSETSCLMAITFPFSSKRWEEIERGRVQQPSLLSNKLRMITVYFDAFEIPPLVSVISRHLLAGRAPVCTCTAFGMNPGLPGPVCTCYLFCGPSLGPALPQPHVGGQPRSPSLCRRKDCSGLHLFPGRKDSESPAVWR